MIKIKNNFDLDNTITCGQIFRYKYENDKYIIILKDRVISLKKDNDYIIVNSSNEDDLENVINEYFDLNTNYNQIIDKLLSKDSSLIINKGLRIISQDPLETIISYIISQNNKVSSISNSINLLCKYGKKIEFENNIYYLFPSFNELKKLTIEDFRNCKVGFRDKYLYNIINSDIDINSIKNMSTNDALNYLMRYKGIGIKVASCILLFAYKRYDVYPIDTWVKKYMKDTYNIEGLKNIENFARSKYGNYCGLALQYMFNSKRNKK